MTYTPIARTLPQYEDENGLPYSGAVLKAYAEGTSTTIPFATDDTGGVTFATALLNASGNPTVSGNPVIPYINQDYKLALYPNQAAADSNTGAIWTVDNIPLFSYTIGRNRLTDVGNGVNRTDAINVGQVQDGQFTYLGTTGGAADAYTITTIPTFSSYEITQHFYVKIHATNATTTPYLQLNGIVNPASNAVIKKLGASKTEVALEPNDMLANGIYELQRNSANNAYILINPERDFNNNTLDSDALNNLSLSASVGSNALTIALKTKAGNDPSAADPVKISFRNSTLTNGTYNTRSSVAATSLVISSGSTLGMTNAIAANLYVYALDNSGTIELGISQYLFPDNSIQSSTAEGGAGAADSATVLYSTTARSNVPVRLIGLINITEATAGTWASNATSLAVNPLGNIVTNLANAKTTNGYSYLANGIIIQWGTTASITGSSGSATITFPIAFPNSCSVVIPTQGAISAGASAGFFATNYTNSNFLLTNGTPTTTIFKWIAIGY